MTTPRISFVSLGLVVLDEIRFPDQEPLINVVGGSGAYGWFPCGLWTFAGYIFATLTKYSYAWSPFVSSYSTKSFSGMAAAYWK